MLVRPDHAFGKSFDMDWNRIEGNWKQAKGKVKEQWGKLTDDDLGVINGRRDQLEGKIQERYGYAKDEVRRDVDDRYAKQNWWLNPSMDVGRLNWRLASRDYS